MIKNCPNCGEQWYDGYCRCEEGDDGIIDKNNMSTWMN